MKQKRETQLMPKKKIMIREKMAANGAPSTSPIPTTQKIVVTIRKITETINIIKIKTVTKMVTTETSPGCANQMTTRSSPRQK